VISSRAGLTSSSDWQFASLEDVSDDQPPEWLTKAARETETILQRMSTLIRAAQKAETVTNVRQARPLDQTLETHQLCMGQVRFGKSATMTLLLAMDAGLRELLLAFPLPHDVVIDGSAATVSASSGGGPAVLDAKTVFLAILWVLTLALPPVVVLELPVEVQSIIAGYIAAVGLTLMIHWRMNDNRKR
jgi:hypothetical protein